MITPPPMEIRITLEHMKHEIVHAMGLYFEQMGAEVNSAIENAVHGFDFQGEIRGIVEEVLGGELRSTIKRCLWEVSNSPEMKSLVKKALLAVIARSGAE